MSVSIHKVIIKRVVKSIKVIGIGKLELQNLSINNYMTWDKLLLPSVPQFPPLLNEVFTGIISRFLSKTSSL